MRARAGRRDHEWYPLHRWSSLGKSPLTRWLLHSLPGCGRERPYAVRLDDEGICELYAGRLELGHRWASVSEVRFADGRLRLQVGGRSVEWPVDARYRYDLHAAIDDRLHPEPEPSQIIDQEQLAAWLGIAVDEVLVVVQAADSQRGARTLLGLSVLLFVLSSLDGNSQWAMVLVCLSLFLTLKSSSPSSPVIASVVGLRHGDRFVPWRDVTALSRGFILTRLGEGFWLGGGGAASTRVADAVAKLLQAKEAGGALPRMTAIPDHALSRAESAEVSAERGISAADGGPEA